jgi:ribonucleotide monophosphatase NagD (HAD superfamily)
VSHIISSGLGLSLNAAFADQMRNRSVFVVGPATSGDYIARCPGARQASHPDQANMIVLAASSGDDFDLHLDWVTTAVKRRPDLPVICINPDHYVQTRDVRYPVIGYFADQLARQTGVAIHWMGKPHAAFSPVVATVLQQHHITPSQTVFLDDNYRNVLQLQSDLSLAGVLVWKTGLGYSLSADDLRHPPVNQVRYVIDSIG